MESDRARGPRLKRATTIAGLSIAVVATATLVLAAIVAFGGSSAPPGGHRPPPGPFPVKLVATVDGAPGFTGLPWSAAPVVDVGRTLTISLAVIVPKGVTVTEVRVGLTGNGGWGYGSKGPCGIYRWLLKRQQRTTEGTTIFPITWRAAVVPGAPQPMMINVFVSGIPPRGAYESSGFAKTLAAFNISGASAPTSGRISRATSTC